MKQWRYSLGENAVTGRYFEEDEVSAKNLTDGRLVDGPSMANILKEMKSSDHR